MPVSLRRFGVGVVVRNRRLGSSILEFGTALLTDDFVYLTRWEAVNYKLPDCDDLFVYDEEG